MQDAKCACLTQAHASCPVFGDVPTPPRLPGLLRYSAGSWKGAGCVSRSPTGVAGGQRRHAACRSLLPVTVENLPRQKSYRTWMVSQLVVRLLLILITAAATAASTVVLRHDGRAHTLDLLVLLLDLLGIGLRVRVYPRLPILDGIHDFLLLVLIKLLTETLVVTRALRSGAHRVQIAIESVLRIDALLHLLVLVSELLRLFDHLLDLLLGEAALVVGDGDLLALSRGLVLGPDIQDAVRVDFEGHLDLRLPARRRRDPTKLELSEKVVVLGHGSLTLKDLDVHSRLVVLVRREDLGLLRGDHRVATDELGHHATDGLNTESERCDVQKEEI